MEAISCDRDFDVVRETLLVAEVVRSLDIEDEVVCCTVPLDVEEPVLELVPDVDAPDRLTSELYVRLSVNESVTVVVELRLTVAVLDTDAMIDSERVAVFDGDGVADGVGRLVLRL